MSICKKAISAVYIFCMGFYLPAPSQVRLPRLIRDSMVLQRETKIKIWGWAAAGEKVTVKFIGKTYTTKTGVDGKWMTTLAPAKAGGPYTMQVGASNKITLKDILVGDVWICSGQSNMVHQMQLHSIRYANEIAQANYPQIRHFWIPALTDLQDSHEDLPGGSWKAANPENVQQFSAVAYFFARKIYDRYKVPIGLINASVGGTPIEAWISEEGLKEFPSMMRTVQKNKDTAYIHDLNRQASAMNINRSHEQTGDRGLTGSKPWYDTAYVPKEWRTINIPGYWEDQGVKDLNGIVWYRREIDLPPAMAGTTATVFLGRIVDADVLYINGKQVGNTTYQYPQRRYHIPPGLLKTGKNIFVIKVSNTAGKGGFVSGKPYCIFLGKDTIDLKGYWQYKVGEVFPPAASMAPGLFAAQNQPTALYNAMIAPLTNYTIRGILWYQGEANTDRAAAYAGLQAAQIKDWRRKWNQGTLPFLFVQLPNFMDVNYSPSESEWAQLRQAQLQTLAIPNTGMAVTIDLGEWNDIHPDNKKDVGERLALVAQKIVYGEDIVYSGPLYKSALVDSNRMVISFTNTGSGLKANDDEDLRAFAVAGADKKFVWAKAIIKGDKVIVWSDEISHPLYVRYAWADNPEDANLYNKEGLPASPFQTN